MKKPKPDELVRLIDRSGKNMGQMSFDAALYKAKIMELKLIPAGIQDGIKIVKMVLDDNDAVGGPVRKPFRPKKPAGKACAKME